MIEVIIDIVKFFENGGVNAFLLQSVLLILKISGASLMDVPKYI